MKLKDLLIVARVEAIYMITNRVYFANRKHKLVGRRMMIAVVTIDTPIPHLLWEHQRLEKIKRLKL